MSSTVTLKRAATGAAELRRGSFEIILDGKPSRIDRPEPDRRTTGRARLTHAPSQSRPLLKPRQSFDAADGTNIRFRCNGAILWPQYLASLFVPTIGLRLHH